MVTVLEEVRAELSRESYVPCLTGTEPYKKVHILAAQHADMLLALADAAAEYKAAVQGLLMAAAFFSRTKTYDDAAERANQARDALEAVLSPLLEEVTE
jgi:hypothetical protein